jgi:hypothetical protein
MAPTERDWHQIAEQLRLETDSDKILSLSLELEGSLEKDGLGWAGDYGPLTQAPAKWGQGPHFRSN